MITACFARALQRCTSRRGMHFLLTFQEVMTISKTRNELCVWRAGPVLTRLDAGTHQGGVGGRAAPGERGGRPQAISEAKLTAIRTALDADASKAAICRTFGVKRTTLYDALPSDETDVQQATPGPWVLAQGEDE